VKLLKVVLMLALCAAALGAANAQTASGTITLYTSESEQQVNEMVADFNRFYPDVNVEIFRAGTGEVIAKLQAEMEAGQILADLIWFADIDFFTTLAERGMLTPYIPLGAENIADEFTYMDGAFHEVRLIFNVVAFNTTLVEEPPTAWADMIDPIYRNRVTMPSALVSGAAFNQFATFVNNPNFGLEFYEALNANGIVVERANGAVAEKIAAGEYAIGQLVDFMARNAARQGSPVGYVYPEEGAMLVPTPIGILANTDNLTAAQAFLDYLYTEDAQKLFAQQSYIPVLPSAGLPEGMPASILERLEMEATPEADAVTSVLPGVTIIRPDLDYIRANRQELRAKFEELFGAPA
jgi:iron(III) transport system substrate-binding protein